MTRPTSCSLRSSTLVHLHQPRLRIVLISGHVFGQLPAIIPVRRRHIDVTLEGRAEGYDQANWKVVVENFLERDHLAVSHPGFADLIDLDKYEVVPYVRCSVQRLSRPAPEATRQGGVRRRGPGLPAQLSRPNFMLNVYPARNASTNCILPIDEHHRLAVYELLLLRRMPEEEQRAMVDFIDQVQREDIIIVESVQRGLRSGFYKQGQIDSLRENGIQHFQARRSALTDSP